LSYSFVTFSSSSFIFERFPLVLLNGHFEVAHRLLEIAATKDVIAAENNYALRWAAKNGHLNVVNRLLEFDAVVNDITALSNYALRIAAENGHLAVVNRLLEFNAVVNHIAAAGNYALRMAAQNGHLDVVIRLLDFPAVRADNNFALRVAVQYGRFEVAHRLLEFAAVYDYAEMHVDEYGDQVKKFTNKYLIALDKDKQTYQADKPGGDFDFIGDDGAVDFGKTQFAYLILRQLIRRNGSRAGQTRAEKMADKGHIKALLSIPSLHQLVVANATNQYPEGFAWTKGMAPPEQNELFLLAQEVNCQFASRQLRSIAIEYEGSYNEDNPQQSAIDLLKDYIHPQKIHGKAPDFFARMITGHRNRNHIIQARKIVRHLGETNYEAPADLAEYLIQQGKEVKNQTANPSDSFFPRLEFLVRQMQKNQAPGLSK